MLLYTMLFFSLGAIVTWLCFCWKADKRESLSREKYLSALDKVSALSDEIYYLKKENEILIKFITHAAYHKEFDAEILYDLASNPEIAQKLEQIFKEASKQQEKEECLE